MITSRIVEVDKKNIIEIYNTETNEVIEQIGYLCDVSDKVAIYNMKFTNKKVLEENQLLKERLLQLEVAEVNRKSKEIEQQILGGTV